MNVNQNVSSPATLAAFQVLNSHMWLVASNRLDVEHFHLCEKFFCPSEWENPSTKHWGGTGITRVWEFEMKDKIRAYRGPQSHCSLVEGDFYSGHADSGIGEWKSTIQFR